MGHMRITIDDNSGFCFGVVRAIGEAEAALERLGEVCSLGDIVHNRVEVQRLETLGLRTVTHEDIASLGSAHSLSEPTASLHVPIVRPRSVA